MKKTQFQKNDPAKAQQYFADKMAFTTGPVELSHELEHGNDNLVVVDVREEDDYREAHIPGAINLPRERWESCEGLQKDKLNVIYCYAHVCHLAAAAAAEFATKGFSVMEMDGGWEAWTENDLKVEKQPLAKTALSRRQPVAI